MELISNEYRKINELLHNKNLHYGTSGHNYAPQILTLSQKLNTRDVLDYGCGKCTLGNNLPFSIKQYDPAIRCFSQEPEQADIVACTDVMEHIEPELLDNVIAHIQSKTKRLVYFVISTRPAKKTLEDGRNAHLIVKDSLFWFAKLNEYFDIMTFTKGSESIEITGLPRIKQ